MVRILIALLLACALSVCAAQDKPKHFDFTQPLVGLGGQVIKNGDAQPIVAMTLGDVAVGALETSLEEDKLISGGKKFEFDQLARKVFHKSSVVLTVEELALIKERIGKAYGPLIVGAAWGLLDPPVEPKIVAEPKPTEAPK